MTSLPVDDHEERSVASGSPLDHLLARNRAWADRKTRADPAFFQRLIRQQRPDYFWIGCSDSRVPATEIVDLDPGEMFVHRNVANLAPTHDANFNAALLFAVDVLHVRHVIVVGHYGCGGIRAATQTAGKDSIESWLSPVRALHRQHRASLDAIGDCEARRDRLCELNVVEQVSRLATNPIIARAWQQGRDLMIHGWIYAIGDGLIGEVCQPVSGLSPGAGAQSHPVSACCWRDDAPDLSLSCQSAQYAPREVGGRLGRDLLEAADICETAHAPGRHLDARIALAVFPALRELPQVDVAVWLHPDGSRVRALRYSSSATAAATLVPPGHWLEQGSSATDPVWVYGPGGDGVTACNAVPALAIAAAALRAWSKVVGDDGDTSSIAAMASASTPVTPQVDDNAQSEQSAS